jgi:hypothetical protein
LIHRAGSRRAPLGALALLIGFTFAAAAQQKGQWSLGSDGLDAGTFPAPGWTYLNTTIGYAANRLNDAHGNAVSLVTGSYRYWLNESQLQYVPTRHVVGGYFTPYVDVSFSTGWAVADIKGTDLHSSSGGSGLSDMFVAPVALGWNLPHADVNAAYAFTAPTGRFSPGASNNVGSGYWGNNLLVGATGYLTRNKATMANAFLAWEGHGKVKDTRIIPGQAVSLEWGLGQLIPPDTARKNLVEVGLVGYDQWQTSASSGVTSRVPAYAVHAAGVQANYTLTAINASFFAKFYHEYSARARTQGNTLVFGGSWTRVAR